MVRGLKFPWGRASLAHGLSKRTVVDYSRLQDLLGYGCQIYGETSKPDCEYYLAQLMKKWFYRITLGLFYTKNAIVTDSFNFMSYEQLFLSLE